MAFIEPKTEKEIVVYRGGWGFRLPAQHRIAINEQDRVADLHQPDRGGAYELERIEETDDELRIYVGDPYGISVAVRPAEPGYPFPTIHEEMERLRAAWNNAGLPRQEFDAWAQGASYDSHTTRLRARLREASTAA